MPRRWSSASPWPIPSSPSPSATAIGWCCAMPPRRGSADRDTARLERLAAIMGREFAENALPIDAEREGARLTGFIGLPTLNRATSAQQFLFVNGRPVRDRLLQGAVRGAYQDFLARDRHPMVALFLELPAEEVDVNVHPAKAEVRFRDPGLVRGLIVGAARHALAAAGHRASTTVAAAAMGASGRAARSPVSRASSAWAAAAGPQAPPMPRGLAEQAAAIYAPSEGFERPQAGAGRGVEARLRQRLSARRGARPAPRDLYRRPDRRRHRHRRPACRP